MTGFETLLTRRAQQQVAQMPPRLAAAVGQDLDGVDAEAVTDGLRLTGRGLRRRAFGRPDRAPDPALLGLGQRLLGWLR